MIHFVWVSAKFGTCTVGSVNGTLVEDKMRRFKSECEHFSFNKCPIYTHDGASAKFNTNSHETDNSVVIIDCIDIREVGSSSVTSLRGMWELDIGLQWWRNIQEWAYCSILYGMVKYFCIGNRVYAMTSTISTIEGNYGMSAPFPISSLDKCHCTPSVC
jgi:hypothetical protein